MDGDKDSSKAPQEQAKPTGRWQFISDDNQDNTPLSNTPSPSTSDRSVHWSASQFVAHHKTTNWYLALAGVTVVASVLVYLLSRGDKTSTGAIIVAALFFAHFAGRKPPVLEYEVSDKGVAVGRHYFTYNSFKTFSVIQEGAVSGVVFMPLKRFMPSVTIYYSPKDEEKIVEILSDHLPVQEYKSGPLDRFLDHIRF